MSDNNKIFIIISLALFIPLYQILTSLQISFSHREVQIILVFIVFFSIGLTLITSFFNQNSKVFLLALITFFFFDVAFEFQELFKIIVPKDVVSIRIVRSIIKVIIVLLLFYSIYLLFKKLRNNIITILAIFYSVIAISTLIIQPLPKFTIYAYKKDPPALKTNGNKSDNRNNLPVVLHIIFDELLSPEAIDLNIKNGRELYVNTLKLSQDFGFRNYGRVYSSHYFSATSMPNMMNDDYVVTNSGKDINLAQKTIITQNNYFDDMINKGHQLIIYQTTHINFCAYPKVTVCKTFDSFDPNWAIDSDNNFTGSKDKLTYFLLLISRSFGGISVSKLFELFTFLIIGYEPDLPDRFDVPGFPSWFEQFTNDIINIDRGTTIFAHFMAPHAPYLLSGECAIINKNIGTGYYLGKKFNYDKAKIHTNRQKYLEAYYSQANCVINKLHGLLEKINQTTNYSDATIIIHGDHGSRISIGNYIEDYDQEDFVANYATFYAIKSPDIQPGYDCQLISLPQIFSAHMLGTKRIENTDIVRKPIYVLSKNNTGEYKNADMPDFKCSGGSISTY